MTIRAVPTQTSEGDWTTTGALFLAAAAAYMTLALWLDSLRAFSHIDTIANADAMWYLRGFVEGTGTGTSWGPRSLIHPNVANLVHPLVSGAQWLLAAIGVDVTPRVARVVGLSVAPLAGAFEVAVCHRLLRARSTSPALLTAIYAALFSTTLFAAIPESFVFTGLGLILLFWHLDREWLTGQRSPVRTVLIGALLIGTTTTNALLFGLGLFVHRWMRFDRARAFRSALGGVIASTFVTAVVAVGLAALSGRLGDYVLRFEQLHEAPVLREVAGGGISSVGAASDQARRYMDRATHDVPAAIAYAMIPPVLPAIVTGERDSPIRFSYQRAAIDWRRTAPILVLLAAATLVVVTQRRDPLYVTAIALLAFHWIFHTVFGEELLLYSRHWNVAAALLLTALVPEASSRPFVRWLLVAVFCAVAANTAYVLWQMGRSLEAHQAVLVSEWRPAAASATTAAGVRTAAGAGTAAWQG